MPLRRNDARHQRPHADEIRRAVCAGMTGSLTGMPTAHGSALVPVTAGAVVVGPQDSVLPALVERAGGAARFAWDEFFYAEHHNPHTQAAYKRAVKRFLAWVEGQGVELADITPKMVGQYLVGLGGSAAKRNQHLAALRGFFDR